MTKYKTLLQYLVIFLCFSSLALVLSACILDTEGELETWDWFVSYDGNRAMAKS